MADAVVVNASPLIFLARGDRLELLRDLQCPVLVPQPVAAEILRRGPSDKTACAIASGGWIRALEMSDTDPVPGLIQAWDLGPGESAVLSWAHAHPGTEAILDDLAGRRCAASLGIPVRGTLGLVLLAKSEGRIPQARPVIEDLRRQGMYLADGVVERALRLVGE